MSHRISSFENTGESNPRFQHKHAPHERENAAVSNLPDHSIDGRTAGNLATQHLFHSEAMHPKLTVSEPADIDEQEANRIADEVVAGASRAVPERDCGASPADSPFLKRKGKQSAQTEAAPNQEVNAMPMVQNRPPPQLGGGEPLAASEKAFLESRLGYDFSQVRVHTDARAVESARAVNALAYTVGQSIVFGAGRYAPHASEGRRLLAHELAHVVQQSAASRAGVIHRQPAPPPPSSASAPPAAASAFTQSDYEAAVALLASRNARLHGYLRQGRVGSTVRVRTEHLPVQGGGPTGPTRIDFLFDLQIIAGGATAGARAQFADIAASPVMAAPTATLTQPLPLTVNAAPAGTTNAANQLAEYHFHEGLHMLIKMDRVMERYVPGAASQQTGMLASFNVYKARAQGGTAFLTLQVDLSVVVGAYFTANPGTPGAPTTTREFDRIANTVIDRIFEERFAVDQQRQQFTSSIVAGTTNDAIARAYLRRYLAEEGVILAVGSPSMTRLVGEATAMLNRIPSSLGALSPPPAGSGNLPPGQ